MPDPRTYLDDQGRELFVSDGISGGRTWGTYRRKPTGSLERVTSSALPLRPTRDRAQRDLDDRAGRKSWRVADEPEQAKGEEHRMSRHVADQELLITEINLESNIRTVTDVTPELVASIKEHGVYSRIIVRLANTGTDHTYDMLDGHRRAKAALLAGHETVPARIYDMTVAEYRETQLLLAEQHKDIDCLDRARAIKGLIDLGRTQQQVADLLGQTQSWVSKQLALLKVPQTHDLIRHGILSGSAAEELVRLKDRPEMLGDLVKDLEKAKEPLTVERVRQKIAETVARDGRPLDKLAHADCAEGCDRRTKAYGADYCLDPECWLNKREAYRESLRKAAIEGGMPFVPWSAAPPALETCPDDCPESGMVNRRQGGDPGRACFSSDSDCYTARQAEHQARQNAAFAASQKLRAEGDAIRQAEAEARKPAEVERLARVEGYLADRIASAQATFSRAESRLLSLWALTSTWTGLEYAARVLRVAEGLEEVVGPALAALSTRELTTIAMAHVLMSDLDDSAETGDSGLNALRDELMSQDASTEPAEREDLLDAARLVNPPDPDDADDDGDDEPNPGEDGTYESPSVQPGPPYEDADLDEEPATPGPSPRESISAHDVATEAAILEATPPAPQAGMSLAAFKAEAAEPIDLRANPPKAAESKSSKAARDCKGDCKRCDQKHCDIHPSHAIRSHPEFEEGGPADEEPAEDELAPLPLEKASYGANPSVTGCPVSGKPTSPAACLKCCSGMPLRCNCPFVTGLADRPAPFHCPGQVEPCPPSVDGGPEDEPAPVAITKCPIDGKPRTPEVCQTCCSGNKADEGCCARVTEGEAPFSCDGVECPGEPEEAPSEAAPSPEPEASAPWTCPEYGEAVEADFCRTCADELRIKGACCNYVIQALAPHRCALCDLRANCRVAVAKGVA
jgi:ParB/RepB/Spo0J family partition protein